MRLKNKKTGEIVELTNRLNLNSGSQNYGFESLAELSEEWEDYRVCFFIGYDGYIYEADDRTECEIKDMGGIGNGFETREEAEKAVEKLKAWKRLKDNGFKFDGLKEDYEVIARMYPRRLGNRYIHFNKIEDDKWLKENWEDLELLFGGEE